MDENLQVLKILSDIAETTFRTKKEPSDSSSNQKVFEKIYKMIFGDYIFYNRQLFRTEFASTSDGR